MKVIYVFERRHVYRHDFESFQMDSFTSKGHEVEVWSAVNWKFIDSVKPLSLDNSERVHYIDNEEALKHEIIRVKYEKCIFLIYPYHGYDYISYLIRKYIKKAGFDFCNITEPPSIQKAFSPISSYSKFSIYMKELYRTLREAGSALLKMPIIKQFYKKGRNKNAKFKEAFKNLYIRLIGPVKYKSLYNFITVKGLYNSFPNYCEICSRRNVLIHAASYDEYLKTKDLPRILQNDYVVYVDDFEIGHPNFVQWGKPFPISDVETHLNHLNELFDRIESAWKCQVVIAAHPKAEYKGNEFRGREIIYYKTDCLIKDAKLVIIGASTCLGTMLIYEKDYLNIFSSEYFINVPEMEDDYKSIARWLKCPQLDIKKKDQIARWGDYVTSYDKNIGDNYKREFVISDEGISDKRMYDAIRDYLCQF